MTYQSKLESGVWLLGQAAIESGIPKQVSKAAQIPGFRGHEAVGLADSLWPGVFARTYSTYYPQRPEMR